MTTRRILVVEDNPKNLKLVRDVLTHSGYEVIEATSGEDGVRLACRSPPGPDPDGPPAPGHRRRRGAAPDPRRRQATGCPIVAVTAFAMNEDRDRAFESGFDGYLEKPISVRGLPQQVSDFLKLGGRRDRARHPVPSARGSSWSTTSHRTSGCSRRSSRPAGTT